MGMAPSTLRYYDKEGLLPFVERSTGGARVFKDTDLEWLVLIECLKKTGMPIREIREFVTWYQEGDATIPQRLELIRAQRQAVQEQMEQLQQTLETLEYKQWYYETALAAGTCAIHQNLTEADVPEGCRAGMRHVKHKWDMGRGEKGVLDA